MSESPKASSPLKKSLTARTASSDRLRYLKASLNPPIHLRFQAPNQSDATILTARGFFNGLLGDA